MEWCDPQLIPLNSVAYLRDGYGICSDGSNA